MRAGSKPTSEASEDIKKAEWYESKLDGKDIQVYELFKNDKQCK